MATNNGVQANKVPANKVRPAAPISAAVAAMLLVFLVLPNPLKVPQQNPTATAEYAPVPGHSDESAQNGNFGETGLANSGGLGAGGDGSGALPGTFTPPPPPQFRPRQKACLAGNPPRQTIDPLSPPCVPFFEGDNGGHTFQGVTKDEISVVLYNGLNVEGDMNTPYDPSQEKNQAGAGAYQYVNLVRTIKAQLRYFQLHYQTYGRTVHVYAQNSSDTKCPAQQGDAAITQDEHHPFAAVSLGDSAQCYQRELAKKYRVPTFGLSFDVPREYYQENAPYIWGFMPDQETMIDWSARFVCDKLWQNGNGAARFSQDTLGIVGKTRKFALIKPENSFRGPGTEQEAKLMEAYLGRCGISVAKENLYVDSFAASSSTAPAGSKEAPILMQKYKNNNVTTMICYCLPVNSEVTVTQMQSAANSLNYYPEWYWDDVSAMDRGIWESTFGSKDQQSFGTSYLWKAGALQDQYHYRAYSEMEPGTQPNVRFDWNIYHLFLNLFEAIQAAGPRLTPQSVEAGMFTFRYTNTKEPYVPSGGYGNYDPRASGQQTFIDTSMGWFWDPTGSPPGGQRNSGCIRPIHGGQRYYASEWPKGDADINPSPKNDCSQDMQKLADPGTSSTI